MPKGKGFYTIYTLHPHKYVVVVTECFVLCIVRKLKSDSSLNLNCPKRVRVPVFSKFSGKEI